MDRNKKYFASALGEMLIDFTVQGRNEQGQRIFAQNAGGAPANVMASIAKLGKETAFIGKAGNDMHGRFLKETLDKNGINSDGFVLTDDYFTTLAFVDINPLGEREFSFARNHGADKMLTPEDVDLEIIKNSTYFHIGSVSLTDEPSRATTMYALEKAKEFGCIISYDPNFRSSLWKDIESAKVHMRNILKYADVVKISDEETELLTDFTDPKQASEIIIAQGVKIAVITLGEKGAYVATKDGGMTVAGYSAVVKDTTGAGDSFLGGLLYKLSLSEKELDEMTLADTAECVKFGNAVASICVEGYGAIPSMPDLDTVIKRIG